MSANRFSVVEGADGAASAWVADEWNRGSGHEWALEEGERRAELAQAANSGELADCAKFDVFEPRIDCEVLKEVAQTRWGLTWKKADGHKGAKARLATFRAASRTPLGVLVFGPLIFKKFRSVQPRNGGSGAWTSRMRFC